MSRCFPYRDSGSVRSGASGEALIQTFKLQSRKEKFKTDRRKERKREKKGKRKERKLYRETEKLYKEKCSWGGGCDEETERLEKSSLTEEHDEPVCRHNLCYLSDGTHSSDKRKRDSPPSSGITVNRNILRIKLPSQKQREVDAEQTCSTSGRASGSNDEHKEIVGGQCLRINNAKVEFNAISCPMRKGNIADYDGIQTEVGSTKHENNSVAKESNFHKVLMGEWIPLPLQPDDSEDLEWLFEAKQQGNRTKRLKAGDDVSCCQSLWPSAQCLQGLDVYALPFTISF